VILHSTSDGDVDLSLSFLGLIFHFIGELSLFYFFENEHRGFEKRLEMITYVTKRLLLLLPVIIILSMLTFFLSSISAGDTARMLAEQKYGVATVEQIESVRIAEGLDRPLWIQYGDWLWQVLHGNLGYSYQSRKPVIKELVSRFPVTLRIAMLAMAFLIVTAIPVGIISAVRPGGAMDIAGRIFAFFSVSTPSFWLGMMLLYFFGARLKWISVLDSGSGKFPILPALTAAIPFMGIVIRMMRSSLQQTLNQPYIRALRAKGLSSGKILIIHGLRSAMIPVLTKLGMVFGVLLCGAAIVESVFSVPGVGKYILEMMAVKDLPVIQGYMLLMATLEIGINLTVDILYSVIDPRIRLQ
jgi:peptide/nickel transport system permease protein